MQLLQCAFVGHPVTRVLPSPLTFHVSRPTSHPLPCAERIEKPLTHRKLTPLQGFHNGMSQISSRSSDAEMDSMCQFRPSGQERNVFPRRNLFRLRDIPSMIACQNEQITWVKPFQQLGKPSIKIMEGRGRLCSIRFQDIKPGKNQSTGNLFQHPRDLSK